MFVFNTKTGFTLVELLVAMAISSIVMAAIYSTYLAQLRSQITQQAVVEMQQNARAAMFIMEREIKMAGYDPTGGAGAGITAAHANTITFTILADNNGLNDDIDNNGDTNVDEDGELKTITYSRVGRDLQRTADGTINTVAENIEVLEFVYFNDSKGPPATPADIRSIQITLIARSGENVPVLMMKHKDHNTYTNQQGNTLLADPGDNFRRIVLTADLQCRNLGLN